MSAIAVLCIVALAAVVIVGVVGAFSSGRASLDDVYARHRARQAALGEAASADPWVTDARGHPDRVAPEAGTASTVDRQPA